MISSDLLFSREAVWVDKTQSFSDKHKLQLDDASFEIVACVHVL